MGQKRKRGADASSASYRAIESSPGRSSERRRLGRVRQQHVAVGAMPELPSAVEAWDFRSIRRAVPSPDRHRRKLGPNRGEIDPWIANNRSQNTIVIIEKVAKSH
jgi:hypothetical protein